MPTGVPGIPSAVSPQPPARTLLLSAGRGAGGGGGGGGSISSMTLDLWRVPPLRSTHRVKRAFPKGSFIDTLPLLLISSSL